MHLSDWMTLAKATDESVAEMTGQTRTAVYRHREGLRLPRPRVMCAYVEISGGLVSINDFYARYVAPSAAVAEGCGVNGAVPCAVCGRPAPLQAHRFHEGTRERPVRIWTVIAPLYYAADTTFTAMIAGFCSARCSLMWGRA